MARNAGGSGGGAGFPWGEQRQPQPPTSEARPAWELDLGSLASGFPRGPGGRAGVSSAVPGPLSAPPGPALPAGSVHARFFPLRVAASLPHSLRGTWPAVDPVMTPACPVSSSSARQHLALGSVARPLSASCLVSLGPGVHPAAGDRRRVGQVSGLLVI